MLMQTDTYRHKGRAVGRNFVMVSSTEGIGSFGRSFWLMKTKQQITTWEWFEFSNYYEGSNKGSLTADKVVHRCTPPRKSLSYSPRHIHRLVLARVSVWFVAMTLFGKLVVGLWAQSCIIILCMGLLVVNMTRIISRRSRPTRGWEHWCHVKRWRAPSLRKVL